MPDVRLMSMPDVRLMPACSLAIIVGLCKALYTKEKMYEVNSCPGLRLRKHNPCYGFLRPRRILICRPM